MKRCRRWLPGMTWSPRYAVMRLYRRYTRSTAWQIRVAELRALLNHDMDAAAAVLRDAARMAESIKADGLPSP